MIPTHSLHLPQITLLFLLAVVPKGRTQPILNALNARDSDTLLEIAKRETSTPKVNGMDISSLNVHNAHNAGRAYYLLNNMFPLVSQPYRLNPSQMQKPLSLPCDAGQAYNSCVGPKECKSNLLFLFYY